MGCQAAASARGKQPLKQRRLKKETSGAPSWEDDGVIVFHGAPSPDLWTVPANGRSVNKIPRPASESQYPYWPQLLPGGKTLLVTGVTGLVARIGVTISMMVTSILACHLALSL